MSTSIVFTFIGADKPALVQRLSNTVSQHGGNWLESRMSQLAGQFAGITRVVVNDSEAQALTDDLLALNGDELTVVVQSGDSAHAAADLSRHSLSIIGNDRPGIVKEVSSALSSRQINVCEMNTNIVSAAMTADPLFEASATIEVPPATDLAELAEALDEIADELGIDISLEVN